MKSIRFNKYLYRLASLKLTISCIMLTMVLVVIGTLYQVDTGAFAAQEKIFRAFFIYWQPKDSLLKIPIFPGGYFLAGIFLLNLTASLFFRFRFSVKTFGIYLVHGGLFLIVCSELLTGIFSAETLMPIKVGQKIDHSLDIRKTELVITDNSSNTDVTEFVFPEEELYVGNILNYPGLPLSLQIRKKIRNAKISNHEEKKTFQTENIANKGLGTTISILEIPPTNKDGDHNYLTVWVEVIDSVRSLGIWLLSSAIEEPQTLSLQHSHYKLGIRTRRRYLPFSVELIQFKHETHPGTNIPKTFSSFVKLYTDEGNFDRSAMITMNQPLKYQGITFYQSGFGEEDTVSVLQVIENPAWAMPYLSSSLVIVGLFYQFIFSLFFVRRKGK